MKTKRRRRWLIACSVILILVIAGLIGVAGCGEDESRSDYDGVTTTVLPDSSGMPGAGGRDYSADDALDYADEGAPMAATEQSGDLSKNTGAGVSNLEPGFDRKVMKSGQLSIEVEKGAFGNAYDKAQVLAARHGGYVVGTSQNRILSFDGEDTFMSGEVVIRVPVDSFELAMSEARKLGEVQGDKTDTIDVTEEYVDLEAAIRNQEAYVGSLQALLARAKTMDEILQVQQILVYAQQQLEQLKGRLQYLDGHTSYSTLTITLYEAGIEEPPTPGDDEEWGFVDALKDALHNVVDVFSYVVKGLGWIIPVLIILGIVLGIAYPVMRGMARRSKSAADESKEDAGTSDS